MKIGVKLNSDGLVEDVQRVEKPTWIEEYQTENAKLPSIPDILKSLILGDVKDISKIQIIPISGQKWHNLTQNEKNQLLELVEYTGQSAEDYCRLWQSQLPRTPRGK